MGGSEPVVGTAPEPSRNEMVLFGASFLTLIAAGIGFSVRGAILGDWGNQFGFTQSELGTITGGGLIGFGITIIVLSFFADYIGYGKLMRLAFVLHVASAVVTFLATPLFNSGGLFGLSPRDTAYYCLNIGMWLFAFGNGTCEAVINPLTATLFPNNKTKWLNILHAGWPAGLILGALIGLGFEQLAQSGTVVRWEYKLGVFLLPVCLYGLLTLNRTFPRSEASASGVSLGTMVVSLLSPILLFLFLIHAMVGYVELGTDSWIINITNTVLDNKTAALLAFIWTNLLMFSLRFFAGSIAHKINPLGLLLMSAILGCVGLVLLGIPATQGVWLWLGAVTIYGIGKTFYWGTMLGVISERFPKGGALALGISGGIGMLSAGLLGGPGIGYKQDYFTVNRLIETGHDETYARYKAPEASQFPVFTPLVNSLAGKELLPPVAGLDNAKVGILENFDSLKQAAAMRGTAMDETALQLEQDYRLLTNENRVTPQFTDLRDWWQTTGRPHEAEDLPPIAAAKLYGSKTALLYTAAIPATMAIGYLLLLLYFMARGGYKPVHL